MAKPGNIIRPHRTKEEEEAFYVKCMRVQSYVPAFQERMGGEQFIWDQDVEELIQAWKMIPSYNSYLEIGSAFGGSMATLGAFATHRTSIDLPKEDEVKREAMKKTFNEVCVGIKMDRYLCDSRHPALIEDISRNRYDLLFIDGGHAFEIVKSDWENYGPLAKYVLFHDIHKCKGVRKVFNSIDNRLKIETTGKYGIGIVG